MTTDIVFCQHCGERFVPDNNILSVCYRCSAAGHVGSHSFDCPACQEETKRLRAAIDEKLAKSPAASQLPR